VRCRQCSDGYRVGLSFDGSTVGSYSSEDLVTAAA